MHWLRTCVSANVCLQVCPRVFGVSWGYLVCGGARRWQGCCYWAGAGGGDQGGWRWSVCGGGVPGYLQGEPGLSSAAVSILPVLVLLAELEHQPNKIFFIVCQIILLKGKEVKISNITRNITKDHINTPIKNTVKGLPLILLRFCWFPRDRPKFGGCKDEEGCRWLGGPMLCGVMFIMPGPPPAIIMGPFPLIMGPPGGSGEAPRRISRLLSTFPRPKTTIN